MFFGEQMTRHRSMPNNKDSLHKKPAKQGQSTFIQVIDQFKDEDGKYDFAKISEVVVQMNEIYDDVSPMIRKFLKK